ncbi:arylamine N-acetyltransferase [Nocardia asteroides NBRC 15531]|uniref:Arylamine N-acetyltransferase n=1 Tax=Nocardia asteroides NBRC 15531 TaxID=1110697 RepID=U5ECH4_NOCAS|nr:arylamine N-acetyltransferase [Nocardia asteroides]TLF62916.1 arylamine N-acetyltransferase [Nocardia asteroides NBRC 15531]UGT46588.1 arylamine N-acetyltransferase [Nocardia asteroides]SFN51933.1 N-hydroxyarylamine O-acetyltransferase [Nocardia asteroides]VEG34578.1 Arylamine N-acetyltransferase [Nocardia asteroides]GAD85055.1 arylamine N-acetyltransferase [Nocardia asteroides NBRC 15531]
MTEPTQRADRWQGEELDLTAYLARIGYDGPLTPTVETLRALVAAHTTTIPFENLEILLGRGIPLDLATLQDKMVRRRRGGYCYENVGLFAAALERIGFGVTGLSGRVSMGSLDSGAIRPATHALLRVTTGDDDRVWICDVGFGAGPLAPFELVDAPGEFALGLWRFRLERRTGDLGTDLWVLHQFGRDGWQDRYSFTLNPQYRIDYAVGNHFVSTSPRSPFTTRPFLQRFVPGVHHVLDDLTLITEYPDGTSTVRELEPTELAKVAADVFDIDLDDTDAAVLARAPWRTD